MTEDQAKNISRRVFVIYVPTNTEGFVRKIDTDGVGFWVQWSNGFDTHFDFNSPQIANIIIKYPLLV